jgi:hypothetical protein
LICEHRPAAMGREEISRVLRRPMRPSGDRFSVPSCQKVSLSEPWRPLPATRVGEVASLNKRCGKAVERLGVFSQNPLSELSRMTHGVGGNNRWSNMVSFCLFSAPGGRADGACCVDKLHRLDGSFCHPPVWSQNTLAPLNLTMSS